MKKIVLIAIAISLLCFALMVFLYRTIEVAILSFYLSFAKDIKVIATTPTQQFEHSIKMAISFAALPPMAALSLFLIQKLKNKSINFRMFIRYALILLLAYVVGFLIKFFYLWLGFVMMNGYKLATGVENMVSLDQVVFYDYSIILACFMLVLLVAMHKKQPEHQEGI